MPAMSIIFYDFYSAKCDHVVFIAAVTQSNFLLIPCTLLHDFDTPNIPVPKDFRKSLLSLRGFRRFVNTAK